MGETRSFIDRHGKKIAIVTGVLGIVVVIVTGVYVTNQTNSSVPTEATATVPTPITSVSALGRIEPLGEIVNVAPSPSMTGAKVQKLLVKEGSVVKAGEIMVITSDYDLKKAELDNAKQELEVAQANLAIVLAGAKQGTIDAQEATIKRWQAELAGVIVADQAKLQRLQAQLVTEKAEKQATIERLKAELKNAQAEFKRYQKLADEGAISQSELETKQLTGETSQQRYQEAQASYARTVSTLTQEIKETQALANQKKQTLTKQIAEAQAKFTEIAEVRDVDVAQAQAQVERAKALVKQAEIELDLTLVKAPSNGTIIEILAQEGENIENAQGVLEMANTEQMIVVAEVYESDISKVKVGQNATIVSENNSFPDSLNGKVIEISNKIGKKDVLETDPAASVDARVVEVKIAVNPEHNSLVKNLIYSQVIVKILL